MNQARSLRMGAQSWPLIAGGLLILSVGITNLGNYAFNSFVSRALPPAQFGTYGIAFAVITIGAVPINVMRLAFVKETAAGLGRPAIAAPQALTSALAHILKRLTLLLSPLLLLALAAPRLWPQIGEAPALVLLVLAILLAMTLVYSVRGFLQGALRVGPVSVSVFIEHFLRLSIFGALVILFDGSQIPLIAMLVGLIGSWAVTNRLLNAQGPAEEAHGQAGAGGVLTTMGVFLVAYVAHTALFSADLILAGFFLDGDLLGDYAALSLAGRIILFANLGVAELVLPVATASDRQASPVIRRTLLLGAAVPLPIILAYTLFPEQSLSLLFGEGVAGLSEHLALYGGAMYVLSLAGLLLSLLLARGLGWWAAMAAVFAAALEVILLLFRHADVVEMVGDVLIAAIVYVVALAVITVRAGAQAQKVSDEL